MDDNDFSEMSDEMAVLLALDALEADERAEVERRHGPAGDGLTAVTAALAATVASTPPGDLRSAVLEHALTRRAAGAPKGRAVPASPFDGYRDTADELAGLLDHLTPQQWDAPTTTPYGRVRDVIAHLCGIEEIALSWLGARPPRRASEVMDHQAVTRTTIEALSTAAPREVAARWHALTREVVTAALAAPADLQVMAHDLPSSVEGLMVLRTFELWAHTADISAAIGRPLPRLDAPRLVLMSQRLVEALPFALAMRGTTAPGRSARLVLTGEAGGCYEVPLEPLGPVGPPDATVVIDVMELCRIAARRLDPAQADAEVQGDRRLADLVLAAADAFARD